jgi:hypothetical protein
VEFDSAYAAKFVALGMGARARALGPAELVRAVEEEIQESVVRSR